MVQREGPETGNIKCVKRKFSNYVNKMRDMTWSRLQAVGLSFPQILGTSGNAITMQSKCNRRITTLPCRTPEKLGK